MVNVDKNHICMYLFVEYHLLKYFASFLELQYLTPLQ